MNMPAEASDIYTAYRNQWSFAGAGNLTPTPTHIDLELVKGCNVRCVYCPQSALKTTPIFMSTVRALLWLAQAKGVLSIKFNWRGEATLHPDFTEIIDYAASLGFADLMLNTNGMYPDSLTESIAKLDTVIFSIDGYRQTIQSALRSGTMLEIIWGNIYVLLQNATHPIIKVNFTECEKNRGEKEKVKERCAKAGIEFVCRKEAPRTGNGRINLPRVMCPFPFQRLTVAYDGRVAPCCVPWHDNLYVGNLRTQSLVAIWHGAAINKIRQDAKAKTYREEACLKCTSFSSYQSR